MVDVATIISLIVAALIYGNLSLIVAAELQNVPFLVQFIVAIAWSTLFLVIFISFAERILNYLSRFKFFKKGLKKLKERAKEYHKHSIAGVIIATIVPLPGFGIYAGTVIGLSLGFNKFKTFWITWLANMIQFIMMYVIIAFII